MRGGGGVSRLHRNVMSRDDAARPQTPLQPNRHPCPGGLHMHGGHIGTLGPSFVRRKRVWRTNRTMTVCIRGREGARSASRGCRMCLAAHDWRTTHALGVQHTPQSRELTARPGKKKTEAAQTRAPSGQFLIGSRPRCSRGRSGNHVHAQPPKLVITPRRNVLGAETSRGAWGGGGGQSSP